MKLRLTEDALRLRLTAEEVTRLAAEGRLEESARFGPEANQALTWALELSDRVEDVGVRWGAGRLAVLVPAGAGHAWAAGSVEGIEAEHPVGAGRVLRISIEKDLPPRRKTNVDQ